ncbi:ethanolaminephosphotransferase 1 isoform X2 [Toxorhynchites rutilus septentrionalis]|uniref:ethanolaminephosphotransferase 1 isoform X2 n=1 Tax=Toxorhynchites rutilus septentrionalis TaxID=329112 RepID=UPI00247A0F31|nr:ethanolaminephosphotransferase 1 isoform X2 [Toxorhynchites rutilus septentrionalis]
MIGIKYLNEAHLKGFEKYKYNCVDTSVLSVYVMHPFWNWLVQYFPRWIAPNVLTFSGFLLTVVNFFLIAYYDYGFTAASKSPNPIPDWVWIIAAINLFVAYTLDGIDGKQARRTGTSGPLGELFDHGLDSYSTLLIPAYMFSLFGMNDLPPIRMHFVMLNAYLNFHLSHVEKYITGVMFLPWGYDFVMTGVSLTLAATGILGPGIWQQTIFGVKPCLIFEITLYVSGMVTSHPIIAYNIYKSYRDKTGKMRPFSEAFRPMVPLLSLFIITSIWALFSRNSIVSIEPRIFIILSGTIFSNINCRLIVAQMSDTRADVWNTFFNLLAAGTIVCVFPYPLLGLPELWVEYERSILQALTFVVTIAHLHYGQGVVREMCNHFRIKCFKIKEASPALNGHNSDGMMEIDLSRPAEV